MDFDLYEEEVEKKISNVRPASTQVSSQVSKKMRIAQENRPRVTEITTEEVDHAYKPSETINSAVKEETPETEEAKPLVLTHQVRHQVAIPNNYPFVPLSHTGPSASPARTYPFTLDPFQQLAIQCIERQESVLVTNNITNHQHTNININTLLGFRSHFCW